MAHPFRTRTLRTSFAASLTIAALLVLASTARAQTYQVIHRFHQTNGSGSNPAAGFTKDAQGRSYGTTSRGGAYGYGSVFRFERAGSGWLLNPIYSFQSLSDGAYPTSRVIFGPDGNLYGTTSYGGNTSCRDDGGYGCGTVFRLQPPASLCKTTMCSWKKTTLYAFNFTDGLKPVGDLVFDRAGNIYGATAIGGQYNAGVAYELSKQNGTWTEQTLHQFVWPLRYPSSGLTLDAAGHLYGVAQEGYGVIYELTASSGNWTIQNLYQFQGTDNGAAPLAGLIFDSAGNLYGSTTLFGPGGGGTAFELSPSGGGWSLTTLYGFTGSNGGPQASLVMDSAGNLWGTTVGDGAYGYGSVFELTPGVGGWNYTSLHDFQGDEGAAPMSTVSFDAQGNLYGTTSSGSSQYGCNGGCGVIWEITP